MSAPSTVNERESRTLPELLQSLPQELFDRIYEETFSWSAGPQNVVDGNGNILCKLPDYAGAALTIAVNSRIEFAHPPTSLMCVDRSSRYRLLKSFYFDTVFAIFGLAGDLLAVVKVKERTFRPDHLQSPQHPQCIERDAFPTDFECLEVSALAGFLYAPGRSHRLKWDGNVEKQGKVYFYNWSWEMEGFSS